MKSTPLKSICDISIGKTPARNEKRYWGQGYPWLSIADMNNGKFLSETKEQITKEAIQECNMKIIPKDSLVISFKLSLGKVGITAKEMYSNEAIAALKIKDKNSVYPEFLYHALKKLDLKINGVRAVKGITLNKAKLKNLQIPLPPLSTQKKIADILDTADELRQKTQAVIDHYDQLAQSLFLEMFGDPVKNPMGWEKKELKQITNISSGSTPSRNNNSNFKGSIPWIKTTELKGTKIIDSSEKISEEALNKSSCKLYPKDTILIAMYGQGITRGKVGLLKIQSTTNQACAALPPSKKTNQNYLFYHLKYSYSELRILGRGGNQPNLNVGLVKSFKVMTPPLPLQNQFANRIALIEQQKELAKQSLQESEHLFNALLQKAFKGEIEVNETEEVKV